MPIQEELTMEAFLGGIDEILQQGFATEEIHGYLRKTLIEPASLQRYVFFRPERYTRKLVLNNDAFELLVICWNIGQAGAGPWT